MILLNVPNHHQLSFVCKTFHEISCDFKYFDLTIRANRVIDPRTDPEVPVPWKLLDIDDIFHSMLKSTRRIKTLKISGNYSQRSGVINEHRSQRITEIIRHFGKYIKKFEVKKFTVPYNIIKLLNCMPNLEDISLQDCFYPERGIDDENVRLELKKLRELGSIYCCRNVLNIFKTLPPGVLRKVWIYQDDPTYDNVSFKLFKSQKNIEDLEISCDYADLIDFEKLKLVSLEMIDEKPEVDNFRKILKSQHALKVFKTCCWPFDDIDMKNICNELRSLEALELKIDESDSDVSSNMFATIFKLGKLKTLMLNFGGSDSEKRNEIISFISHESLSKLHLECDEFESLSSAAAAQLGTNLPKLNQLKAQDASINVLSLIVQHFQNLEYLELSISLACKERFVHQDGITNKKLKTLVISANGFGDQFDDLPKLIGCCEALRSVKITSGLVVSKVLAAGMKEHEGRVDFQYKCEKHLAWSV